MAIAGLGVFVVLAGILVLRLHPLIALLLASLLLLALTPEPAYLETRLGSAALRVTNARGPRVQLSQSPVVGERYVRWPKGATPKAGSEPGLAPIRFAQAPATAMGAGPSQKAWLQPIEDGPWLKLGERLVSEAAVAEAKPQRLTSVAGRLGDSLGRTFGRLGLAIVMAAVIGVCLLESGGAARLAGAVGRALGPRHTFTAFAISGFILAIPVFFDTVFYLLLPLAKAHARRRPQDYLGVVMATVMGGAMAHSLVPPTPGPLFVADALGVSIGTMMVMGSVVGVAAAASGVAYGLFCNRRWPLSLPDADRVDPSGAESGADADGRTPGAGAVAQRPLADGRGEGADVAPGLSLKPPVSLPLAALPIALPIALLGSAQLHKLASSGKPTSPWEPLWAAAANPGLVLFLSALLSLTLLRGRRSPKVIQQRLTRGIADAGMALLLICAGGAFGAAIKGLQIGDTIAESFPVTGSPFALLTIGFLMTALIRGAQGSATVAMITSVSILSPLLADADLPYHPVYVALAIGCGSKPLNWMNDSGFWLVTSMTGLTPAHALRTHSVGMTLMGVVGFVCCLLGAWLLPLV